MFMVRVESAGRALQGVSLDAAHLTNFLCLGDLSPGPGIVRYEIAYAAQLRRWRAPYTAAEIQPVRRQVNIESRRIRILAGGVAEMNAGMGFIRGFIPGKTNVAVDAEHRSTMGFRVCDVVW